MRMLRSAAWLSFASAAVLAACATTGNLGTAAERLDRSAQRFHDEVQADPAPGHTARDAAQPAKATRDFSPGQILRLGNGVEHSWEAVAGSGRVIAVEVKGAPLPPAA